MLTELDKVKLRKLLSEICSGFSIYKFKDQDVIIKHRALLDELETDYYYQNKFEECVNSGVFNEKDQLNYLIANDLWTRKKEKQIEDSKKILNDLYDNKRKVYRFAEIESYKKQIEDEEKFLFGLIREKSQLCGDTAESLAQRSTDLLLLKKTFFSDRSLNNFLYTDEEFESLSSEETEDLFILYRKFLDDTEEKIIKSISVQPFFTSLFYLSEDVTSFFGVSVSKLTHLQNRLITWAKYFSGILQNTTIPREISDDAEKIEDYYFGKRNLDQLIEKYDDQEGNLSLTISKEEMKFYGIRASDADDKLIKKLKENGGEMTLEDQIKLGYIPLIDK